jgi:hypothetical protein
MDIFHSYCAHKAALMDREQKREIAKGGLLAGVVMVACIAIVDSFLLRETVGWRRIALLSLSILPVVMVSALWIWGRVQLKRSIM